MQEALRAIFTQAIREIVDDPKIDRGEALLAEARENPDSPLGQELIRSEEAVRKRREESFFQLGRDVRTSFGKEKVIMPSVRNKWSLIRATSIYCPPEDQAQFMTKLATGMGLSESNPHKVYAYTLAGFPAHREKPNLTPAAQLFAIIVSQLDNCHIDEVEAHIQLEGRVALPQTFRPIAGWLEQKSKETPIPQSL